MYNVYFDNILQAQADILNINDVMETSIIREDGYNSTEQIIREKCEMEIQFTGASYSYIRDNMINNPCYEISITIEDPECGYIFNGIVPVTLVELSPAEWIGKTKIKDDSFSAYIRDYIGVKVDLFNTKTTGCEDLTPVGEPFRLYSTYNNTTDYKVVNAFDVLDILTFMISYYTNNTINVQSTYLTNNKYAITTGFNMHNYAGASTEYYPSLSFQELFGELRKKFNLYMGIEYDSFGNPYLRIEQQSYFFLDGYEILNIAEIPPKTKQVYDIQRNFNEITTGSETYELVDSGNTISYPQKRYISWNKETYSGCGTCAGEKDSNLDLLSTYIIDSNVIYEVLNWGLTDYDYDSNIFMFNYEVTDGANVAIRTLYNTSYYFNESLRNEIVLANWIDYYGNCISVTRYPESGFLTEFPDYTISVSGGFGFEGAEDAIGYTNTNYDLDDTLDTYTGNASVPDNVLEPANIRPIIATYFQVPIDGTYNLRTEVTRFIQISKPTFETELDIQIQIVTYTDNTFTTILNTYEQTVYTANAVTTPTSLSLETGDIALSVGNCAITIFSFYDYSGNIKLVGGNYDFVADNITFQMLSDGSCTSIEYNDENTKPYQIAFDYPLCYSDYLRAVNNKGGYIMVKDKQYWIKEIKYKHKGNSGLTLIGNYSL